MQILRQIWPFFNRFWPKKPKFSRKNLRFLHFLTFSPPFFRFELVPPQHSRREFLLSSSLQKNRTVKWTPRREGDSRMTSSPSQGLAPVTTVHEETRAASGGAALTQQDEEANAVGTAEFATNRRGGKRKRDAKPYFQLRIDE